MPPMHSTGPLKTASLAIALGGGVLAQEPPVLEPTIVEAERFDEDPSAVSVISRASLRMFQADSFDSLSGIVPGFNVVSADSRGYGQVVAMRGSTNTLFFGPPALGFTIDDVPLGDAFTYPSELLELSEVRVYRGPQGPYFGRNGPAGMVEMFTPRPGDRIATSLSAEYGSYDHYKFGLHSLGPIAGDFSYSLQLFHDQRDGYIRNTFLSDRTDDRESTGGLLNLFWNPADDFELRLRFFTEHVNDGSQRLSSLGSPDPFRDSSDFRGETDLTRYQWSLHSRKDLAWGRMETISSYQTWDLDPSTVDLDLRAGVGDNRSRIVQNQDLISNEIRFSSADDSRLGWRAGLFHMMIENDGLASRRFLVPVPPFFPTAIEDTRFSIDQLNLATYGNVTWQASERLAVDAGLRLDYHESKIDRLKTSNLGAPPAPVRGSQNEWFVSPVAGLTYGIAPAVDVFLRSGLGNKPAGFSAYSDNPAVARYDRETNWSNEIGVQYDCAAYHLRVGARAFWDRIDDYHVNQSVPFSTDFVIVNADRVNSRGVELDAAWAPIDRLTIRGSLGYVNAKFDSYQFAGISYDGNKVPFVPEYTGSAAVRYDFDGGFYAQTTLRVSGSTHFDSGNTGLATQGSHSVWDAEVGYGTERYSIALYGQNLLDEQYYTFINPQIQAGAPGTPQIFGVRLRTTF